MTVDRKCASHQGGVKGIRKLCQLMGRSDGYGGCKGVWGGVTIVRKCDSPPQEVCQLVGRCDGHGEM